MPVTIVVAPVAPGRLEEWRAFHAELTGMRRRDWSASQRRRGITREAVFLSDSPEGATAVYLFEGPGAGDGFDGLTGGAHHFDDWLRARLAVLHTGLDHPRLLSDAGPDDGHPSRWWRRWRR